MNKLKVNYYNIFLDIDLINFMYKGVVLISIDLEKNTNILEINSKNLKITSIKINNNKYIWETDLDKEIILIKNNFDSGKYKIKIKFDWKKITDEPDGFYFTKKNNKIICCTQLEPISARKFIPCFDSPDLKSIFNVVINLDLQFNCISNMSIKKIDYIETSSKKLIYFNSTPLMSTYLLCLVCGDIVKSLDNPIKSLGGTLINGYCISEDKKYINWSIQKTAEALDFFEYWFGIKYPLDKLDIVSIPNFTSGAMENWGLITFREEFILLFNKNNYLTQIKILEVIYHEVAHQWFGNLVTLSNWKDLWLNESTATFFSWMALLNKYSNYNSKEFYWLLEYKSIYLIDGFTNTHPIIINNIGELNPSDLFDEITYSKGNTIINYVANLLVLDNFQKAISKYLNEYKYSNPPNGNKLFDYFNEYSINKNIDYVNLMYNLTNIKGYPILYININTNNDIIIKYKTFNLDKKIVSDYKVDLFLKIKIFNLNIINIINLKYNEETKYNSENEFIINPDNEFFCICFYDGFIPNIKLMNQVELMKYIHDEYILGLYGYKKIDYYLDCIINIFNTINLEINYILLVLILSDLINLINIYYYSSLDNSKLINFIKNNLDNKLTTILFNLTLSSNKYLEFISDEVLTLKMINLNNKNLINITKKLYDYQNNLLSKSINYNNNYYLSKTIFNIIMKYYQDTEFNNLLNLLKTCSNIQIIDNIISSFMYLNDNNFNFIFKNYTQIIKSQDYSLLFSSMSKILHKQEYIINYWINNRNDISTIDEITFKILKNISNNIFNFKLIDNLINYLQSIYSDKNKLIIDKIIDILHTNKIIIQNI
jgi:tricorn protease interacting factor F2/3